MRTIILATALTAVVVTPASAYDQSPFRKIRTDQIISDAQKSLDGTIMTAPKPATESPADIQRRAALDAAWQARCKPEKYADADGMTRTKYAESGCDLQLLNK